MRQHVCCQRFGPEHEYGRRSRRRKEGAKPKVVNRLAEDKTGDWGLGIGDRG